MFDTNVNAEDFTIIVDNDTIDLTASMNVLGINIDDKLNFNSHVSNMCNYKAGRQLNVLQRLKGSLDYASRLSIYKSFTMSNFNYCPVVWMFTSKSSLSKIFKDEPFDLCLTTIHPITMNCWIKRMYLGWKLWHWGIWRLRYTNVWMASTLNIWMTYLLSQSANTICVTTLLWIGITFQRPTMV